MEGYIIAFLLGMLALLLLRAGAGAGRVVVVATDAWPPRRGSGGVRLAIAACVFAALLGAALAGWSRGAVARPAETPLPLRGYAAPAGPGPTAVAPSGAEAAP